MNSKDIIWIPGYNLDSNCYLIDDMLVDTGAGDNKEYLFSKLKEHDVNPEDIKLIVNTHCHFDHVNGNCFFPNAKIAIHKIDAIALMEDDNPDTVASHFGHEIKCHKVDIELEEGDKISNMLDVAGDLGFQKAITVILGLGETLDDVDYLIDYIKDHKIDRVIFYSLNPHKETAYANSSQPASLYYAQVVSKIRLTFPDITIICGTWIDNLANIGILILSGANGITKFPLFKMFGTKYGKRVEEEVKWSGRQLKGTFTDKKQLGNPESNVDPELNKFIKRYIKESLKNKY